MDKKGLIVANWKMNGDLTFIEGFFKSFVKSLPEVNSEIVICPPLPILQNIIANQEGVFSTGAQDCHHEKSGAYTGEVSASLLKNIGCSHVILGHSERRRDHKESDGLVSKKALAALKAGLVPIICVGETDNQREAGQVEDVITDQVNGSIPDFETAKSLVIAYEPVWSIGTGKVPEVKDVEHVLEVISTVLTKMRMFNKVENVILLYGGSVNAETAPAFAAIERLDGFLVGGASLKPEELVKIVAM